MHTLAAFIENYASVITLVIGVVGGITGLIGMTLTAAVNRRNAEINAENARVNEINSQINKANLEINRTTLLLKMREDERKEILQKLNTFYGPLQQLLSISYELYQKFGYDKGEDFRTLTALLNGTKFTGNDEVLFKDILEVIGKANKLIMEQSRLVDSPLLTDLLAKASVHFQLIQQAADGKLIGESARFANNVYPRELNKAVELEIASLNARLAALSSTALTTNPANAQLPPPSLPQQQLPPRQN